jgi:hypothetical protein
VLKRPGLQCGGALVCSREVGGSGRGPGRQSAAGIRHMLVETGREPCLVEENVFCHDRLAEARQPYEVSRLFQVVTGADVDARFAAGFELALALQFCGGF